MEIAHTLKDFSQIWKTDLYRRKIELTSEAEVSAVEKENNANKNANTMLRRIADAFAAYPS